MHCIFFDRGYCKNGSACRFRHVPPGDAFAGLGEQRHFQRPSSSSSSRLLGTAAAPFVPSPVKRRNLLLQQLQEENLRRIFVTFPPDSTFTEEDVSSYFSTYGPVQDVRFPFQHERIYGFVTFMDPETVKLILAMGIPHIICDSRVLVKPCKEKGQILKRNTQLLKHGDDTSEDSDDDDDDGDEDDDDDPSLIHDTSSIQVQNSTLSRLISKQPAASICKGGHIVIRGRPCKVVQIHSPRAASSDSTDFHFVGIDIFNGRKLEDIVPSSHICDVPSVDSTEYQLTHISEDGFARLVSESGETRDDLSPPASKSEWIKRKLEQEKIKVIAMSAMGEAHICSLAVVPR